MQVLPSSQLWPGGARNGGAELRLPSLSLTVQVCKATPGVSGTDYSKRTGHLLNEPTAGARPPGPQANGSLARFGRGLGDEPAIVTRRPVVPHPTPGGHHLGRIVEPPQELEAVALELG